MRKTSTAERLKTLMEERHMRQADILEAAAPYCKTYGIKMGRNALSQYVSGKVEPRQDKLSVLSMALNVSEAWLMGYDVPRWRSENEFAPTFPWGRKFRSAMNDKMSTIDSAEWAAACIRPQDVDALIENEKELTFDQACELASRFGISIDSDVLENNAPVQQDERTSEVIRLFGALDQEHQETMLQVLRGLLADQKTNRGSQG